MRLRLLLPPVLALLLNAQPVSIAFNPVSREAVEARLAQLPKKADRRAALERLFAEAGCTDQRLTTQPVKRSREPNVICTMPGETEAVIVAGAHFDFAGLGKGAADNWSGAALLPSLFEALCREARHHTFVFVGFTGEEQGLVGSTFYVKALTPEQAARIRAMVNIDTLGLSPTKVAVNGSDKKLTGALVRLAQVIKSPLEGVNVERVGTSDFRPFADRRIPAINIHSLTQQTLRILHSPWDDLKAINLDDYYESYRLVAAYLALLDVLLN